MALALKASKVSKTYPNGVKACRDIDLEVERGSLMVLAGPNGAGKTTFLRMISTALGPTSGQIEVMGFDVVKNASDVRNLIGVMHQHTSFLPDLNVREHIYYFTILKGITRNEAKKETDHVMNQLDLIDHEKKIIRELSGGFQRRVMLAQALTGSPQFLLLDEPSTGLDPKARKSVWKLLQEIQKEGTTILLNTHYLDEITSIASSVTLLNNGIIISSKDVRSTLDKVGYELRVEVETEEPIEETIFDRIRSDEFIIQYPEESNKHVVMWIRKNSFSVLSAIMASMKGLSVRKMEFERPQLEEAYLSYLEVV
jgi:ABC-2 type transport system ATP-binding protein